MVIFSSPLYYFNLCHYHLLHTPLLTLKILFPFVNKSSRIPIFDTLNNKLSKSLNTIFHIVMQTISELALNDNKLILEKQHKALLFVASIAVKSFLMAVTTSYIFCKSLDPNILFFHCSMNIVYVGISIGAILVIGTVFGYFIIRIKGLDDIFVNMMKSDYIVTTICTLV